MNKVIMNVEFKQFGNLHQTDIMSVGPQSGVKLILAPTPFGGDKMCFDEIHHAFRSSSKMRTIFLRLKVRWPSLDELELFELSGDI